MSAPTTLLRPALEAAVQVARAGESADPVQPAPPALRRFLRFARLPAPALDIARRVVEEDDEFRQRVASQLTRSDVGEAGWLWLSRPEGWEEQLDELRKREQEREHAERDERAERDATRRLGAVEDRARRAEAAITAKDHEATLARAHLTEERARRQTAEQELAAATEALAEMRAQRSAAVRQLKDVEAELARRTADLRHARHEIRMRQAELAQVSQTQATQSQATQPPAAPSSEPAAPEPEPTAANEAVNAELARFVTEIAGAAERLAGALGAVTGAPPQPVARPTADTAAPRPSAPASGPRPRRPLKLPWGVRDDSTEAAEHVLRAGVRLLVDGYNISQAAWSGQPIAAQRARLVDALSELHARTGVDVDVVFDGADAGRTAGTSRSAIRVRFTPAGVEADDAILEQLAALPATQPVAVASSDNRVRDGARRQGANVLSARQLLSALRR